MEPEPGNSYEEEGVLNPAVVRGRDGQLYLFPRLVARGNHSRIGIARVRFGEDGDPIGVDRVGIALEPEAEYELREDGGGCEDPRISFVDSLGLYVMTYTAFSPEGPRIALAVSQDLFLWERLGLATFKPEDRVDFNGVNNKDGLIFPVAVPDSHRRPAMAMIHRPLFPGTDPQEIASRPTLRTVDLDRESMWISYCPLDTAADHPHHHLCHFHSNHRLAAPRAPWEGVKVGGGAPPVLTSHGWLVVYHGVTKSSDRAGRHGLRYSAAVLILDRHDPRVISYRSPTPILSPELPEERHGVVSDVVFPTGVDRRTDLGLSNRIDVYYGMADSRIGVARMDLPDILPSASRFDDNAVAAGDHQPRPGPEGSRTPSKPGSASKRTARNEITQRERSDSRTPDGSGWHR